MSGPIFSKREAAPLDAMIARVGGDGWEGLEELFKPHLKSQPLQPSETVAKNLAQLVRHENGRQIIEWLMDISHRAPLQVTSSSFEETALRAAQKQGINGFADAILSAIAYGNELMEKGK